MDRPVDKSPRAYAVVTLIYALGFAIVGSALYRHFGFPLDDSWIHQSVGRNFARLGSLGYLPHQRSSGSTSLLWTLVLSLNYRLLPTINPVVFTLAFNIACALATALLLLSLALRDGRTVIFAMLIAVAPAFDGNYLWLAFTGMEHMLFISLSMATIWSWTAPIAQGRSGWPSAIGSGLCMGLLSMTRPEGIVLPAVLLGAALAFRKWRPHPLKQTLAATAIFLLLAGVPLAVNLYTSHSLLPVTFKGRQWMLVNDTGSTLHAIMHLPSQWSTRLLKPVVAFAGGELSLGEQLFVLAALAPVVALLVAGVRLLVREGAWRLSMVCGWGGLHALLYLFILPSTGHGGRYQPFLLLLLLPLLFAGAYALLEQKHRRVAVAVPAVGLIVIGGVSLILWRAVLGSGIDHIANTHGAVATWLSNNLATQSVAVFDIGRIGYERGTADDPHIVDLGGLTDPDYLPYLYGGRVPHYLAAHGIQYVVLPTDLTGESGLGHRLGLADTPGVRRTRLFRACSDADAWRLGWLETGNAVQCQEVDRIQFENTTARR